MKSPLIIAVITLSVVTAFTAFATDPEPAQSPGFEQVRITEAWAAYADVLSFDRGQTLALLDDGCKPEMPQWKVVIDGIPKTRVRYDAVDDDDDAKHEGRGYHGSTIGNPSSLNYKGKHGVAFNNLPEAMMRIFQNTGKAVADPATGLTFKRLDVMAALQHVLK